MAGSGVAPLAAQSSNPKEGGLFAGTAWTWRRRNRARLEADLPVDVADDVAVLAELHVRVIDQPGAAGRTLDGHRCGDATTQVTKSIVTMRAGRFRDQ
jgi:hypothetical protein